MNNDAPETWIIDFETYYDQEYSLRNISVPEFVLDPRFKVFGMSVTDEAGLAVWVDEKDIPAWLERLEGHILVAHNGFFDFGVLKWRYGYSPTYMLDTLLMANHVLGSSRDFGVGGNDLGSLALRLGLGVKGKTIMDMRGVRDPDEAQLAALAAYAKQDGRLAREVLNYLLPLVSNQDFELWLLDHTLRIYTEKALSLDPLKIELARSKMELRRAELVAASGVTKTVLNSNKQFAEELSRRLQAAGLDMPTKKAKRRKDGSRPTIPATAKSDPGLLKLATCPAKPVADLVNARIVERSAVTVASRLATMQRYHKLGIGIPVHLVYYGAHTGRFSGGGGFNFQNLTSPARAATEFDRLVAELIREAIVPGDGFVFVPDDAAQIEARVEAWLAGEDLITQAFASGADIYSDFISDAMGETIYKPKGDEPKEVQSHLKLMRQVGKEAILGLGYSMGTDTFMDRLRKEKALWPMLEEGGRLSPAVCQGIVDSYREKYTKITQFWDDLNRAFMAAIKGSTRRVGKLLFKRIGAYAVGIQLPSGRMLNYRHLRQEEELTPKGNRRKVWKHGNGQKIYGGLLAENVTQAVARDILVEAIHDAEAEGYPVVLHVHDEIVCRVPAADGPACLAFLDDSLRTPPSWGEGLVLGSEGHVAHNLGK